MKTLFGTDGMRAVAGEYPLDPATVHALGGALVGLLRREGLAPEILVGRDTRESGAWIEAAFIRGVLAAGGTAHPAGVVPTSAVAYLTKMNPFSAGAVISASHNPFRDNGIKIFSHEGFKIPDAWEERLEESLPAKGKGRVPKTDASLPAEVRLMEQYERLLITRLDGVRMARPPKVVLDCSNGAASRIAPEVYRAAGCEVVGIHCAPDGRNINRDCGSLHPRSLAEAVVRERADLGIAFDGDADRALMADEGGRTLNGDHGLYILARFMSAVGTLKGTTVVATTMSNMGLETALRGAGLDLVRTKVGDKYVLEKMLEIGANLGGERSGHTILLDDCPTGDGLLTGLRIIEVMAATGGSLSQLAAGMVEYPQILLNVPVAHKPDLSGVPAVAETIEKVRIEIGGRGRLDVRYSGTESVARVMVEGPDQAEVESLARRVADAIAAHLGREER